jgi:hypothetical protein
MDTIVSKYAQQYGVPLHIARTLLSNESGGLSDPVHAFNKGSGASGPMQLLPDTFHGVMGNKANIWDADDNIHAGVKYYRQQLDHFKDPTIAAMAYNWGPGNVDNWIKHGRNYAELPEETRNYAAKIQASNTFFDDMPLPPHADSSHPTHKQLYPGMAVIDPSPAIGAASNVLDSALGPAKESRNGPKQFVPYKDTQEIKNKRYGIVANVTAHQDFPYIMESAYEMDQMMGTGAQYSQHALSLWSHSQTVGQAEELYGPESKNYLTAMSLHGNPMQKAQASFLLTHPWAAAGENFVEEMLNPLSILEGGGVSKVAGLGMRGAKMIPGVAENLDRITHWTSPYREIVAKHGEAARNAMHQAFQQMRGTAAQAESHMLDTFEGLTHAEQFEALRRQQNLTPHPMTNATREKAVDTAARKARKYTEDATASEMDVGSREIGDVFGVRGSKPGRTYTVKGQPVKVDVDPGTYVRMQNSYDHPTLSHFEENFLNNFRTGSGGAVRTPKVFDNVDEAFDSGKLSKEKFSPAENFRRAQTASMQNVAFTKGIQQIAKSHPDMISSVPRPGMESFASALGKDPKSILPELRNKYGSVAMIAFLKRKDAAAVMSGVSDHVLDENADKFLQMATKYNGLMRQLIIANPLYHPLWNIATNSSVASNQSIPGIMKNYVKAGLGAGLSIAHGAADMAKWIPGVEQHYGKTIDGTVKNLENVFWGGANQHVNALMKAARDAGAMSEIHSTGTALGGLAGKIKTLPYSELNNWEKADKFLSKINDWNAESTFGKHGEDAFAASLFGSLSKLYPHLEPKDVGWMVREALGNYQNINPNSIASKYMFFYPWLKTNMAFWMRTFFTKPRYVTAPDSAFATQRKLSGDPREGNSEYPPRGAKGYLGKTADGSTKDYTAPLPSKDIEHVFDTGNSLMAGDLRGAAKNAYGVVSSRLNPVSKTLSDVAGTMFNDKAHDAGQYSGGYTSMWNENDSRAQKTQDLGKSLVDHIVPLPLPMISQSLVKNIGHESGQISDYLIEAAGLGFISTGQKASVTKFVHHSESMRDAAIEKIRAKRAKGHIDDATMERQINVQNEANKKRIQRVMDPVEKKIVKSGGNPLDAAVPQSNPLDGAFK